MRRLLLSDFHQQIMFIEILPFLFLSLILIDKNKRQWISPCICMALFHNYFYTPGMILILLLYDYDQNYTIKEHFDSDSYWYGYGYDFMATNGIFDFKQS